MITIQSEPLPGIFYSQYNQISGFTGNFSKYIIKIILKR